MSMANTLRVPRSKRATPPCIPSTSTIPHEVRGWQGPGRWERVALHGHVPEHPPQGAGTEYFSLDVEDVHAAGSAGVRPQERVLRHTVEQFGYVAPGLPALHVRVPQTVGKLEDVLKIVDLFLPVQEIDVPKISSLSRPPPRRVLPVPHTAEQLVDVPSPAWMRLALGCDAAGRCVDLRVAAVHGVYWSVEGTRHTQMTPPSLPTGFTASPGRYFSTGQR